MFFLRIAFFIIMVLLGIFSRSSRYRYRNYRRMSLFNEYSDFNDGYSSYSSTYIGDGLYEPEPSPNWISVRIRRINALRKCQNFLISNSNIYNLRNKHVIFVYDRKDKTMTCSARRNKNLVATVVWADHPESLIKTVDNDFEEAFDNICNAFDKNSNYEGIVAFLNRNLIVKEKTDNKQQPQKEPEQKEEKELYYIDDYLEKHNIKMEPQPLKNLIDINNSSENELATLPGVSIIMAKKAVKYRKEHNGFKNINEFYTTLKIKDHFQDQIDNLIIIVNVKQENNPNINATSERIIDF